MSPNTQYINPITVDFFVNCKTYYGQSVYLCGNCPELGDWTPQSGLKLQTNRKSYPQWFNHHPLILKPSQHLEFKICIIRDGYTTWECFDHNRFLSTGINSFQVYISFSNPFMGILEKKTVQIECRTYCKQVMEDLQSQWGSSIGHPSNYALTRFHMLRDTQLHINRSQISSNLISVKDNQDVQFQLRALNYLNPFHLRKTLSKPCSKRGEYSDKKIQQSYRIGDQILQDMETQNSSLKKRSYWSLPKQYGQTQKATLERHKLFNGQKSYPKMSGQIYNKQVNSKNHQYTQTYYSEKLIYSEKQTVKASWISQNSVENYDRQIEIQDQISEFQQFQFI